MNAAQLAARLAQLQNRSAMMPQIAQLNNMDGFPSQSASRLQKFSHTRAGIDMCSSRVQIVKISSSSPIHTLVNCSNGSGIRHLQYIQYRS